MKLNKDYNCEFKKVINEIKTKFINGNLSERLESLINEFNKERSRLENLLKKEDVSKEELETVSNKLDILEMKIIMQNKFELINNTIKEFEKLEKAEEEVKND